MMLDTV